MKEGLADEIKSRGYWRINFRPLTLSQPLESLQQCEDLVDQNRVSLRGWDYPHMPRREGDDTGVVRLENAVEGWVDWSGHREFWRMYTSSQFLHYRAINTEWRELDRWGGNPPSNWGTPIEGPVLGVIDNAWMITEACEFLSRLHANGLYDDGVELKIQLMNTKDRTLWIDATRRSPFSYDRKTGAESLTFARTLGPEQLENPRAITVDALAYFFDKFGWQPAEGQLTEIVSDLYDRRF